MGFNSGFKGLIEPANFRFVAQCLNQLRHQQRALASTGENKINIRVYPSHWRFGGIAIDVVGWGPKFHGPHRGFVSGICYVISHIALPVLSTSRYVSKTYFLHWPQLAMDQTKEKPNNFFFRKINITANVY